MSFAARRPRLSFTTGTLASCADAALPNSRRVTIEIGSARARPPSVSQTESFSLKVTGTRPASTPRFLRNRGNCDDPVFHFASPAAS